MPASPSRDVGNDRKTVDTTSNDVSDTTNSRTAALPKAPSYSIRRFLTDQHQRAPPGLGRVRGEAEAEGQMLAQLQAFDAQFGLTGDSRRRS
ncbi:hypothetical protein TARUN_2263 [Trichoderma arundinaceum]|uniref:Uncharacterized protein n=1 Tax=Trichoderma arundinaceum TaxID=490622 RepID=A0A395NWT6_TRIAR|nr:hypothetical protein TARUN_2263 [Trichoderma arundinaceum]